MDAAKKSLLLRTVMELYTRKPTWVTFYKEVLGWDGLVMRAFPTPKERAAFEKTDEYRKIGQMLDELRQTDNAAEKRDPDAMSTITLRLPRRLHDALLDEAKDAGTSLNSLCVQKLARLHIPLGDEQPAGSAASPRRK